jgi:hypothetical protein
MRADIALAVLLRFLADQSAQAFCSRKFTCCKTAVSASPRCCKSLAFGEKRSSGGLAERR